MAGDVEFSVSFLHRLRFVRDLFNADADALRSIFPSDLTGARYLVFIDKGVTDAHPELPGRSHATLAAIRGLQPAGPTRVVPGGEIIKNDPRHLADLLESMHAARLCRQSYVIAIGGGAMLDAVGYAAALTHRGVRLIRVPSTTLAQADSGVGVKNGVNAFGQKNYLGVFSVPWAVFNDEALLQTLSDRDWRCGFAESVKVALLKDAGFFRQIERDAERISQRDETAAIPVIRQSARLHRDHITAAGDPFEHGAGRPLDFGHWAAHRLEVLSGHSIRHGEAVAIGMALDVAYALQLKICDADLERRVRACLTTLGFDLWNTALDRIDDLLDGLEQFREHLGGRLAITLVAEPGRPVEVDRMDRAAMQSALTALRLNQPATARVRRIG